MTTSSRDHDLRRPGLQRETRRKREALWESASVGAVGMEMAIALLIGALFGRWLDGRLDTEPLFTIIFLGVGIAAAFKGLIRVARKHQRQLVRERDAGASDAQSATEPPASGDIG